MLTCLSGTLGLAIFILMVLDLRLSDSSVEEVKAVTLQDMALVLYTAFWMCVWVFCAYFYSVTGTIL